MKMVPHRHQRWALNSLGCFSGFDRPDKWKLRWTILTGRYYLSNAVFGRLFISAVGRLSRTIGVDGLE